MKSRTKLDRNFFSRPAPEVARDLLGKILVHGRTQDVLVEVEAYLSAGDPAAHAYRGWTPRTRVLFGPPGYAYLYLNYGLHWMMNIAVEPEGLPGCVLLRGTTRFAGPGLLSRGFALGPHHYGADLTGGDLFLFDAPRVADTEVDVTPRIGIRQAAELPLRFVLRSFNKSKRQPRNRAALRQTLDRLL